MMALDEPHDCSWVAKEWEAISVFVCFLYSSKAAANFVSKLVEDVEVVGTWDIVIVEEAGWMGSDNRKVAVLRRLTVCQIR